MTAGQKISVGIVDDNRGIVSSLKTYLEYTNQIEVAICAYSAEEFLTKLKECDEEQTPAVVITDINMPGMSGIELVRRAKLRYPDVKFLMLTVNEDEEALFEAIKAGAEGYLMKDEKISAIADLVVGMVQEGGVPMTSRIARKTLDLLAKLRTPSGSGPDLSAYGLSGREKDVLQLLVMGRDYKAIATELHISPHTVRKHIANIYSKLHVTSKAQVINLVHATGSRRTNVDSTGYKAIIVDDHRIILESLSMMLGTLPGIQIIDRFDDSREVMPYLDQHAIDLLITDVSMPLLNGVELARQVRTAHPEVKILMLTVSDDPMQVQAARDMGVQGYLLKKAGKKELQFAIDQIMNGGMHYFDQHAAVV